SPRPRDPAPPGDASAPPPTDDSGLLVAAHGHRRLDERPLAPSVAAPHVGARRRRRSHLTSRQRPPDQLSDPGRDTRRGRGRRPPVRDHATRGACESCRAVPPPPGGGARTTLTPP